MTTSDTIVAISSAVGMSARMILRLSGPDAFQLARQIGADDLIAGTARRVRLRLPNLILSAWIYAFRSPRSYSGEDMIELHIPGNPLLARMLHDDLLRRGARPAEP
jgi:tRNA modification GTPase